MNKQLNKLHAEAATLPTSFVRFQGMIVLYFWKGPHLERIVSINTQAFETWLQASKILEIPMFLTIGKKNVWTGVSVCTLEEFWNDFPKESQRSTLASYLLTLKNDA